MSNTNFNDSKVIVYPNPSKNEFSILGLLSESVVSLFTVLGNQLFEQTVSEKASFDISHYNSGIYILK